MWMQVVVCMVLSILTAVSAAVQLGMGAGSAVADYAVFKNNNGGYVPYNSANYSSSAAFQYFDYFGCSDKQRDMYLTVSNLYAQCIGAIRFHSLTIFILLLFTNIVEHFPFSHKNC